MKFCAIIHAHCDCGLPHGRANVILLHRLIETNIVHGMEWTRASSIYVPWHGRGNSEWPWNDRKFAYGCENNSDNVRIRLEIDIYEMALLHVRRK